MSENPSSEAEAETPGAEQPPGVGRTDASRDRPSEETARPSDEGSGGSGTPKEDPPDPQADGDHLRDGHTPRVSRPLDVDRLDKEIQDAFRQGQPAKVWDLIRELTALAHRSVREAAESRFKANFGSPQCGSCDGLKAGPGVVATCFQTKCCYFTNVKVDETTPKHQRAIDTLLGD